MTNDQTETPGMKSTKLILNIFGWYGTAAILTAYALVSFGVVVSSSWLYQILNLTGALGIIAVSFYRRDYQPGVLNVIWAIVALAAMLRMVAS